MFDVKDVPVVDEWGCGAANQGMLVDLDKHSFIVPWNKAEIFAQACMQIAQQFSKRGIEKTKKP